MKMRPWRD